MCACTTRSAALPGPALQSATAVLGQCSLWCTVYSLIHTITPSGTVGAIWMASFEADLANLANFTTWQMSASLQSQASSALAQPINHAF